MHNVNLLEKEWRKYSIKKWLKKVLLLILLAFPAFFVYYLNLPSTPKEIKPVKQVVQKKVVIPEEKKVVKEVEKPVQALDIQEGTHNTIERIKARYHQNRTYEDAIYLAKAYYKNKEYEKVEYWTLEANKLNSSSDESWVLFSKTKFILGEEKDAIFALEAYLEKNESPRLEELLVQMHKALDE